MLSAAILSFDDGPDVPILWLSGGDCGLFAAHMQTVRLTTK